MSSENPAHEQPKVPPNSHPEIQTPKPVQPPITTQPQPDSELQEVKKELTGYEKSTLKWTRVIVGVNVLTLFFIGLQWYEMNSGSKDTHTLAEAAKESADLTGKQLKGTAAAVVDIADLSATSVISPILPPVTPSNLRVGAIFENKGQVIAHKVRAELTITKQTLPARKIIGKQDSWLIDVGELIPAKADGSHMESLEIVLAREDIDRINRAKETIKIEGVLYYLNGFDNDPIKQPVCFGFLPTSPVGSNAWEADANGQFQRCNLFETNLRDREIREQYPHKPN